MMLVLARTQTIPAEPARQRLRSLTSWSSPRELVKVILILTLPVAVTNALQSLIGFVDTRMVSALGEEALAAMSVCRVNYWMLMSIFMGLGNGVVAYVARMYGAEQHEKARAYAAVGVVAGAVVGIVIMLIGLIIGQGPIHFMVRSEGGAVDTESMRLSAKYAWDFMSILYISLIGVGVQFAAVSSFNAVGRTLYPMWLLVIANIVNFLGNYYLIPIYQVAGSAWSTTITTLVVSAVAVWLLYRIGELAVNSEFFNKPARKAWEMAKIGIPVCLQISLRALSMMAILKLITFLPNSIVGQSALQVGIQAESLAFMPAFAFSTAVATLVGQNLGARRPDQAKVAVLYCVLGSQVIMWTMAVLFYLFPEWFIKLFIGQATPSVIEPAAGFLRILALCLPGLGVGMTLMGALRGSGDTQITAWISLGAMWVCRIPLAIFLGLDKLPRTDIPFGMGYGLHGIWWAMTITVYIEMLLSYWRFSQGHWARVKLADV
jgi:putative MATE family efflux protein